MRSLSVQRFLPRQIPVSQCILGESLSQTLQHAVVVDDETEILTGINTVGSCDCLH